MAEMDLSPGLGIEREATSMHIPCPWMKSCSASQPQVDKVADGVVRRKREPYGRESYNDRFLHLLLNELTVQ